LSNPSMLTFSSDELYGDVTISAPDSSVIFKEQTLYRDTFQIAGVQTGTYLININRDSYSPTQYSFKLTFDQAASPEQIQTLQEGLSLTSGISVLKNAEGTLSVEVEPNNNRENANPIYSGVTVSGNFVNGDLDMYSFSLSNPSILTFFSDELYGGVTIYAPDSSVIFKEETLYRDTFQVAGVQSGTYLINVNRDSYSPAQYSFKLTFDQAAINQDAEIIELKSQVSTLTSEKTGLEAQLQTANTRISELESELAILKSQQSSNSNPSSTTTTSINQSSASSSTAVEVKKVASIKAYGLQFSLSPSYTDTGSTIYFTSYDGSSGYPLNDNNTVSSEVKNLTLGSSSFYTDYLVAEGYVYMHGTATLNMPTTDSDGNGVLDFLQKERSVNTTVSGSSKMHWLSLGAYGSDSSLSGSFTRSAGLNTGNYTFDYQYDSVKASATGVWSVQYFDGSIEYDGEKYYLSISTTNSEGRDISGSSTAEYSVTDSNTLNLGAMSITTDYDSSILQTQSTTLKRSGNKYSGYLKALDGDTDTSWADYVDWYLEVTDLNDANSDGVPDFTNPVETKSAIMTVEFDGWNWHKGPWVYNNKNNDWNYYSPNVIWSYKHNKWFTWDASNDSWKATQ